MPINPRIAALALTANTLWDTAKKINYEYRHVPSIVRNSKSFIDWVRGRIQNPDYYPPYYYYNGRRYYPMRYGGYRYGVGNPRRYIARTPGLVAASAKRKRTRARLRRVRKKPKKLYTRTEGKPGGIRTSTNTKALTCANYNLGDPVGFGIHGTRKRQFTHDYQSAQGNKLYGLPLIAIPYDADEKNLVTRFGGMVHLRGVRLHTVLTQHGSATHKEYWLRWALVSAKNTKKASNTATDISGNEFFEDPAPATLGSYSTHFTADMTEAQLFTSRINRREYCVIKEGRKFIYNESATFPNGDRIVVDEYIPINRQIRFDLTTDIYPEDNNIWFVFWACPKNKLASDVAQPADFMWKNTIRVYFKTPKGVF